MTSLTKTMFYGKSIYIDWVDWKRIQGKIIPPLKCIHCMTHRRVIREKKVNPEVHQALQNGTGMVNLVESL